MVNHTDSHASQGSRRQKPKRPFGFWDFIFPAILGGVIYVGLTTAMQTIGPKAMAPTAYFGGVGAIALVICIGLLFVVPIAMLFIMPRTALKMLLVMWPTDAALITLLAWVMNHVSIPI